MPSIWTRHTSTTADWTGPFDRRICDPAYPPDAAQRAVDVYERLKTAEAAVRQAVFGGSDGVGDLAPYVDLLVAVFQAMEVHPTPPEADFESSR